jgi:hypothetical protein
MSFHALRTGAEQFSFAIMICTRRPGVIYGTTTPLPYVQASTAPDVYNGTNVSYFPYNVPILKISQHTLSVQRQFGSNMAVQIAFVGSHGFDLIGPDDANAVPISEVSSNDSANRPYPNFQNIASYALAQHGVSSYYSLQVTIESSVGAKTRAAWTNNRKGDTEKCCEESF